MTSSKPKSSYVVRFAQIEADQDLLLAIEQALEDETYKSFSDLCKQALRRFLFSAEPTLPMVTVLEQQLMILQLQMMQLEQRSKDSHTTTVTELERRIQQLSDRVTQLEQQPRAHIQPEAAAEPEPDPLLSRLAPFLDDF
jgi:Arc/MetJ-type ribon-helix-helix transcriptional regulator